MFAENQNLPFQPEQVRQVLGSPAGKKLLQLLTQDGGAALQQAAARLKAGDTAGAQAALAPFLSSEEAAALLQQITRSAPRGCPGAGG